MDLERLKLAVLSDNFRITLHALKEKDADNISLDDIKKSLYFSEIIEEYPKSRPLPSCLVLGFTSEGDPIHTVWAYDEGSGIAIMITVYRPNPEKWVEYKRRK